jgi:MoxR-like ATPase
MVGREKEFELLEKTLAIGRHLLIEGPVGVGKTFLVREALAKLGKRYLRVDGDSRFTEQKLTGWFDPPQVLKTGYRKENFQPGPLVEAMQAGQVLFINELNRMPEGVQNILLPALDERCVYIPHLGEIRAQPGFQVIGTQNPREFTATVALAEALLDRFELLKLSYQSREEEITILGNVGMREKAASLETIIDLVRATRAHELIKRGASLRAAIAIVQLMESGMSLEEASVLALSSRIELISPEDDPASVIRGLLERVSVSKKKD